MCDGWEKTWNGPNPMCDSSQLPNWEGGLTRSYPESRARPDQTRPCACAENLGEGEKRPA